MFLPAEIQKSFLAAGFQLIINHALFLQGETAFQSCKRFLGESKQLWFFQGRGFEPDVFLTHVTCLLQAFSAVTEFNEAYTLVLWTVIVLKNGFQKSQKMDLWLCTVKCYFSLQCVLVVSPSLILHISLPWHFDPTHGYHTQLHAVLEFAQKHVPSQVFLFPIFTEKYWIRWVKMCRFQQN